MSVRNSGGRKERMDVISWAIQSRGTALLIHPEHLFVIHVDISVVAVVPVVALVRKVLRQGGGMHLQQRVIYSCQCTVG